MPISGQPELLERIAAAIAAAPGSALPFSDFMRCALYDPDFGYYASGGQQRVGRGGDFYTSVSVGACFGQILAHQFLAQQPGLGQVVEQGANDGQLAEDLLRHLPAELEYIIIEPFPALRARQEERLGDRVRWVDEIGEIAGGITGRFVCNELLDAFPVRRVQRSEDGWQEMHISPEFEEVPLPISNDELESEVAHVLGARDLPLGYTTELHLEANAWMRQLVRHLQPGSRATVIDYGHGADDYYANERDDGTLRGYREHRQVAQGWLEQVGETDLTASLNFSRLAEIASAPPPVDQHHYLIEAAKPWLSSIEESGRPPDADTQKLLRQFQTLIHPGLMGRSFKVLEFGRQE